MYKISSLMAPTKKKVGVALLSGALIAAVATGTALAADSKTSLMSKMENGVTSFSTDDGKTWSDKAPEGVKVSEEDGKLTISNGTAPKDGPEGVPSLTKVEDGVTSYSTDNGKTWSTTAPEGAEESYTIGK